MATQDRNRQLTSTRRLENFSDGIIAIAITLLLNLAFLACLSLTPLVTDLMNQYAVGPAVATYATVMTPVALSELAIWLHAERHGMVAEAVSPQERAERRSRLLTIVATFGVSIPVALLSPLAAQLMWLLILLRVPLGRLRGRRHGTPDRR